jgi:hypothetical protein
VTFTVLWALWVLAFVVIEAVALKRKARGDTLSEHIWRIFAVRDFKYPKLVIVRRLVLLYAMIELTWHFTTGGWVLF